MTKKATAGERQRAKLRAKVLKKHGIKTVATPADDGNCRQCGVPRMYHDRKDHSMFLDGGMGFIFATDHEFIPGGENGYGWQKQAYRNGKDVASEQPDGDGDDGDFWE